MNNSNYIDPYRRNLDIMRKFFSKPIVLILAIAYTINFIAYTISEFLASGGNIAFSVNITIILTIIAFCLFYFCSKSNKSYISYKAPIILLKINTITMLVISSITIVSIPIIAILIPFVLKNINISSVIIPYFILAGVSLVIEIIHTIAMLVLLSSFKKSTTSVYLYKNGSNLVGITSILLIIITAITELINELFGVTHSVLSAIANYSFYDIVQIDTLGINYASIVNTAFGLVIYLLLAVFAFSYSRYISKLSKSFNNSVSQSHMKTPTGQSDVFSVHQNQLNTVPKPVEFNPLPVFTTNHESKPESGFNTIPVKQLSVDENPYLKKRNSEFKHTAPPAISCPNCGSSCPVSTLFCGNCGAKLK